MSDFFANANHVSQFVRNILIGFAVWKGVVYFTSKDKNSEADLCEKWNAGTNILIGHQGGTVSAIKALVNEDDKMINESTFNRVDRRFREIKKRYGPEAEVHLHLHTPGGELFFAILIAHIVNEWKGKVVAHIHSYSASGGTIIALACEEVHMDALSVLGPVDPQVSNKITHYSLTGYLSSLGIDPMQIDERFKVDEFLLRADGDVVENGQKSAAAAAAAKDNENAAESDESKDGRLSPEQFEKMLEINMRTSNSVDLLRTYKKFLQRILLRHYAAERVDHIIQSFWIGRDHSSPIWRDACKDIGINVVFVDDDEDQDNGGKK